MYKADIRTYYFLTVVIIAKLSLVLKRQYKYLNAMEVYFYCCKKLSLLVLLAVLDLLSYHDLIYK
jgi:hypothetical protein